MAGAWVCGGGECGFVEDGQSVVVVGCGFVEVGLWVWGCGGGGRVVDLWVWFKRKENKRVHKEEEKKERNELKKMKGREREMN